MKCRVGDPETTAIGETTDATEVSEMLDAVCVEECELYAECNPDDPEETQTFASISTVCMRNL